MKTRMKTGICIFIAAAVLLMAFIIPAIVANGTSTCVQISANKDLNEVYKSYQKLTAAGIQVHVEDFTSIDGYYKIRIIDSLDSVKAKLTPALAADLGINVNSLWTPSDCSIRPIMYEGQIKDKLAEQGAATGEKKPFSIILTTFPTPPEGIAHDIGQPGEPLGLSVTLKVNMEEGAPEYCDFDFGDGSPKFRGLEAVHGYHIGEYTAKVICYDFSKNQATASVVIKVKSAEATATGEEKIESMEPQYIEDLGAGYSAKSGIRIPLTGVFKIGARIDCSANNKYSSSVIFDHIDNNGKDFEDFVSLTIPIPDMKVGETYDVKCTLSRDGKEISTKENPNFIIKSAAPAAPAAGTTATEVSIGALKALVSELKGMKNIIGKDMTKADNLMKSSNAKDLLGENFNAASKLWESIKTRLYKSSGTLDAWNTKVQNHESREQLLTNEDIKQGLKELGGEEAVTGITAKAILTGRVVTKTDTNPTPTENKEASVKEDLTGVGSDIKTLIAFFGSPKNKGESTNKKDCKTAGGNCAETCKDETEMLDETKTCITTGQKCCMPKPTYKCFKSHINWATPSKSVFWPNWEYWKSHLFECIYDSTVRLYSVIEATSLVHESGTCSAEQPLPGALYCESCNMSYTGCTPERCKILGTACKAIPTEKADQVACVKGVCEPTSVPVVENMDVRFYIDRTHSWRNFTEINPPCPFAPTNVSQSATCIKINNTVPYNVSDIEINISLNQLAKCRYIMDKFNSSFDEMTDFDENQYYPTSQRVSIDVTNLELGQNHTVYIKCEGTCIQRHDPGFDWNYVKFEFQKKPDELPPVIVKVVPDPEKQYISSESTNETIEVWLDEAGYCKYSHRGTSEPCGNNLTTNWTGGAEKMCAENQIAWNVNSFTCNRNGAQCCSSSGVTGESTCYNKTTCGRCFLNINPKEDYDEINWTAITEGAELPELAKEIPKETLDYLKSLGMTGTGKMFTYMFRCADTPAGNVMNEEDSYLYVIMTYPPFEMNLTKPENNSETYEREIEIAVNTSRATECRYLASNKSFAWPDWENMGAIDEGFAMEHSGKTAELYAPSNYILYARCRDAGGLEQKSFVRFKILKDMTPPKAIRFYKWEDYLYMETDELSDCVYGTGNCNYNFSDGSVMVGNMQYIHSAPWSLDNLYYIKCRDRWNNTPSSTGCTTTISPYEVPSI